MPRPSEDRTCKEMIDPPFVCVVARVESLPVPVRWGRGRKSEGDVSPLGERQVEGLFETLQAEAFEA